MIVSLKTATAHFGRSIPCRRFCHIDSICLPQIASDIALVLLVGKIVSMSFSICSPTKIDEVSAYS